MKGVQNGKADDGNDKRVLTTAITCLSAEPPPFLRVARSRFAEKCLTLVDRKRLFSAERRVQYEVTMMLRLLQFRLAPYDQNLR
jgi:hypothetical protein